MSAWRYEQSTGMLTDPTGKAACRCYSGTGAGRNNPAMEAVHAVGPIPRGRYRIGRAYHHPVLGPVVMNLDALPGTDTYGRGDFRIHGNNAANDASHGCVISPPDERRAVDNSVASGQDELEVV